MVLAVLADGPWGRSQGPTSPQAGGPAIDPKPLTNPTTGLPNPEVPLSSQSDLDAAVLAAQSAFPAWSRTPLTTRRALLTRYATLLETHKQSLVALLTQEQGKPLSQAQIEVEMAITWTRTIPTLELPVTTIEDTPDRQIIQRYVPIGVCGAIVPWNFPVLLAVGKIVPALVTGNTILVKPSPFTPYCALKLGELAAQVFPPGVVQVLSGGEELGPWMTAHPGILKISFTGSSVTGRKVMEGCARGLKRVTLELGGNDAAIVCGDVDVDAAVQKIGIIAFLCSSQICMTIKRLYVHERIYDEFRDKLVAFVRNLPVGDGTQPATFFGPVQNRMQFDKATDLLAATQAAGLRTLAAGEVPADLDQGFFIPPTLVDNPPEASRVVQEEPFAPILPLLKWSDEADVIARANASDYALSASVWSRDLGRARRIVDQLQAGSVWVNSHFDVAPHVPFGGHKASGMGTEWGVHGLVGWCNSQTLWLKSQL
ncbi:putative aldehyde dehydrogenase [Aspergillus uvarum CBS 121591]|uniref:aldehyde dehydrogenase (NAD(+)) n=1 Tax=Aspergillus uvarum CBS 121591 TaxID=1448315 RepID=A0A319CRK8_9EURO|nr:putative aldehyde dehydrogenase [Aspergillus uvarum CBS 121591]PYH85567.1 putative aldehyde dehydrogenase [Aspergillus uvarum CBS 121591]